MEPIGTIMKSKVKNTNPIMTKLRSNTLTMANNRKAFITCFLAFSTSFSAGASDIPELTTSVEDLTQGVESACPKLWEDLGEPINTEFTGDVWASAPDEFSGDDAIEQDKSAYVDSQGAAGDLTNIEQIAANCTAARTALLSKFYSNLPQDVVAAMSKLDYKPGDSVDGFEVGDIRHTGRRTAAKGWIFLAGQTVGSASTSATLKGEDYKELYQLARYWAPNAGTSKNWSKGDIITLPNMSGRVIAGGSNSNIGRTFGSANVKLNTWHLPTHTHSMANAGHHNHAMGIAGNHGHKIRTSLFKGSSVTQNSWNYFEGRARPNYQNTIPGATIAAGNHKHSLTATGNHKHTISSAGSSSPVGLYQPSMYFRVEMKYK